MIQVKGLVQGVGFRPFVYRLAQQYHLNGWVVNGTDAVTIKVEGLPADLPPFIEDLRNKAPVISRIEEIAVTNDMPEGIHGFFIMASQDLTSETSEISPDIAVCPECLADMIHQPHRLAYPFINCTNCGPRFSIVKDFPYDRVNTTMASFKMCSVCNDEYTDISNRRFHAQPVACHQCGPIYTFHKDNETVTDMQLVIKQTADLILKGGIIVIKGTGGFHLMCNAMDEEAVSRLRMLKKREGKPFAVMFRNTGAVKEFADVSEIEELSLSSWRRPIVILKSTVPLPESITLGINTIGAFLPYMPIHYLLFEALNLPCLVLTSGNISDEPIIIDNEEALKTFSGATDAVITYNREIYNRTDDSVVCIMNQSERVQRRSRGYVPSPVKLDFNVHGVLATGAELSNCFCLGKGNRAYLSQHIGDIKNYKTFEFYEETLSRFQHIFRVSPVIVAADLHPDYLSTRFALKSGLETILVQHHHAHIASCMAENGLDEPVIGIAFDGTGYGVDNCTWGSEFMVCDYQGYKRLSHFSYMPMPGGDLAATEPWRMGLSLLYQAFGESLIDLDIPLTRAINKGVMTQLMESISKNINAPLSSGAGRLFDAVASITGICIHSLFHAEAPMRLESKITPGIKDHYPYDIADTLSFVPAIKEICRELSVKIPVGVISAKFHNTITDATVHVVNEISSKTGLRKIVLSGGTFQNKYLFESLVSRLNKDNFNVYSHTKVPCNDGGIALGQLAVAAKTLGGRDYGNRKVFSQQEK